MKILVCKHAPQEGLGYFEKLFTQNNTDYEYQELDQEAKPRQLEEYQGLIIMGGPMNVDQIQEYPFLKVDYKYIEQALGLGIPVLGFCLGAQLLAKVLGAKVYSNSERELGWYDLDLIDQDGGHILKGFPKQFKVFEWHEDTFDLPDKAQLLASSPQCTNQAFSWGHLAFGLQFHLEVTTAMLQEWLREPAVAEWGFHPEVIQEGATANITQAEKLCHKLYRNFLSRCNA